MKRIQTIRYFRTSILLFFVTASVQTLFAQTESEDKTLSPYFMVYSDNPDADQLPLKETTANVRISGSIADVTVRQVYKNEGKNTLEAVYVFPMSTKAAVYAMQMRVGNRIITARIEEKNKARKDYEEAKKSGKRTSLLEQNRPNVFTMNVGNIISGDEITIELKYTELLIPEEGVYSFVYPTVTGPRYTGNNKSDSSEQDSYTNMPYNHAGQPASYKSSIDITVRSAIPIQDVHCVSHKMQASSPDLYTVRLRSIPAIYKGNKDVIINYSLRGKQIESGIMLYEGKEENFFLLMMQPPKKTAPEAIPPREYIFIIDVSGSMSGFPLEVSKKLIRNLIVNLKPNDRFNVVLFESNSKVLSEESLEANEENIAQAIRFIDNRYGGGGTEILAAIKQAYAIPRFSPELSRSLVIITDGYISVEKEVFDFIRSHGNESNFFSFGIGSSVNRFLLEGIAFAGHGEAMVVTGQGQDVMEQAEKFRQYISSPVLTQIKVNYNSLNIYDVEPLSVPDILAERPVIIYGKYRGKLTGTINIQGKTGSGTYEHTLNLSGVKPDTNYAAIPYLWARERIKLLEYKDIQNKWRNYNLSNDQIRKNITTLGLKYHLMTSYTSFIAIDEAYITDSSGKIVTVKQALPLPEGVSDDAVSDKHITIRGTLGIVEEDESEENVVFSVVESMPSFPGGEAKLVEFINNNLVYPKVAQENGIQGRVILQFTVEPDGTISNIIVLRSINPDLDKEAIRILKTMPKWKPGKQRGKNVSVQYTLPINFRLK